MLALDNVAPEIVEFGRMAGCTRRQLIGRVMMPVARAPLMVGVNQVIMLSLNMVIIASMIGAGGLGFDVLTSLRRLDIGAGLEAGRRHRRARRGARPRQPGLCAPRGAARAIAPASSSLQRFRAAARRACRGAAALGWRGIAVPALRTYPGRAGRSRPRAIWDALVRWLNVNFFDTFEAIKTAVLLNVLLPVKRFLLAQPWPWVDRWS